MILSNNQIKWKKHDKQIKLKHCEKSNSTSLKNNKIKLVFIKLQMRVHILHNLFYSHAKGTDQQSWNNEKLTQWEEIQASVQIHFGPAT